MKQEYTIYGLKISGTRRYFYIGITKFSMKERLSLHFSSVNSGTDPNKRKCEIINSNYANIEIHEIKKIFAIKKQAYEEEIRIIELYRKRGHPLVNKSFKRLKLNTIKIADGVHKELKVFVAKNPEENMTDFSGYSIMKELRERGHEFTIQKISNKIKKSAKK